VYHTTRRQCAALARINADGTADVQCGTSDMGPGTYTSMTQVAADALGRRRGWKSLDAQQTWSPDDADQRYSMSAYGAVFAEVAVDETLSTMRIRRIYGCYDAGRIINPKLAHSQAIGGMVGGIGMALLEGTQLDYRDGRIVNANMSDYLVPINADVPALDAAYLPAEDMIADPLGVKGLGELVIVAVPAAIANAVFNATGRRVTDLPITLEKLL
jgi:xanthine dehydrogenase YagR molybdenum-binding subunit